MRIHFNNLELLHYLTEMCKNISSTIINSFSTLELRDVKENSYIWHFGVRRKSIIWLDKLSDKEEIAAFIYMYNKGTNTYDPYKELVNTFKERLSLLD